MIRHLKAEPSDLATLLWPEASGPYNRLIPFKGDGAMEARKFNREKARNTPGTAVLQAVDDHRVEAARIGASVPETILGLTLQAKRHGGRVDYYVEGVRMARDRVLLAVSSRVDSDNNAKGFDLEAGSNVSIQPFAQ